jgi:hypothetical protein
MKIDELVGYKNKPEYQAVKDSDFITALMKKLNNLGYQKYYLGSGIFGSVYARPEDDFVVKVFQPDRGYSKYLNYMQTNKMNPYVPKLRGKPIKLPNNFTLVRLEKLTPISSDLFAELGYISGTLDSTSAPVVRHRKEFEEKYPQFLNFVEELKAMARRAGVGLDLHSGNVMMRNNLPVITDPFS